jgi:hypothetical protein
MKTLLKVMVMSGLALAGPAMAEQDQSKPAGAAAAPTQATSEGAVRLFIEAMRKGDFQRVVNLTDPGSAAYEDLQKMADAFDPEKANPNIDKATMEVIREFFTKPWKDVEHKQVTEQGSRAQYTLIFHYVDEKTKERKRGEDRTIDLNQFEGQWRVLVSSELMKPATPVSTPVQPPEPSKPAGEAPAAPEKPAKPQ